MATFRGRLKPDDPIWRTGFLIMHPKPFSPGGKKPGTKTPDQKPQPKEVNKREMGYLLDSGNPKM
jgi:hypothetical protein